jgi:hypothetical protein
MEGDIVGKLFNNHVVSLHEEIIFATELTIQPKHGLPPNLIPSSLAQLLTMHHTHFSQFNQDVDHLPSSLLHGCCNLKSAMQDICHCLSLLWLPFGFSFHHLVNFYQANGIQL